MLYTKAKLNEFTSYQLLFQVTPDHANMSQAYNEVYNNLYFVVDHNKLQHFTDNSIDADLISHKHKISIC